jgi:hypothetical protein
MQELPCLEAASNVRQDDPNRVGQALADSHGLSLAAVRGLTKTRKCDAAAAMYWSLMELRPTVMDPQLQEWDFSCAYRPYERQHSSGSIDAVHRDVIRVGIRHVGELSGRMDGYRARK